jgi:5-methylcytosine-specific restriction endonuclease McrA
VLKQLPWCDVEIPAALMSFPFPCPNCDAPFNDALLFCSEPCKNEAKFVRYSRACLSDGRYDQSDVQQALRIRLALIVGGGYSERARHLSPSVRALVFAHDEGKCRNCREPGIQIDHIQGSSGDLANLQLLCRECHDEKTTERFVTMTAETHPEEWAKREALLERVHAREPIRVCDSAGWENIWRPLMKARRELTSQTHRRKKNHG